MKGALMNKRDLEAFRRMLLEQRRALFREVEHVESDLGDIAADRESELEETAQGERMTRLLARLDQRGKAELEAIDRALQRIDQRKYGVCEGCGKHIPLGRLGALPATSYCRDCAERVEQGQPLEMGPEEGPRSGPVPPDYSLLTERELEEAIREQVRDDGRVDTHELRIVCRHGVVYFDGSLPSEAEHQILLHTVTDVMGLSEIVDRVQIKEILWDRDDRSKEAPPAETRPWEETYGTEDVVEAHDTGVDFVPPAGPGPDEE